MDPAPPADGPSRQIAPFGHEPFDSRDTGRFSSAVVRFINLRAGKAEASITISHRIAMGGCNSAAEELAIFASVQCQSRGHCHG